MIIYSATKKQFMEDVFSNDIDSIVHAKYIEQLGRRVGASEQQSWRNSLMYVNNVLHDPEIPEDMGVFIEYHIQQSSKRVDLLLSGWDGEEKQSLVLVELKQWSEAEVTDMDGIVLTQFRGGLHETSHPSYQAWTYASLLHDFNEVVYSGEIGLHPCAYAHNFGAEGVLDDSRYAFHIARAPLFLKRDARGLQDFIKQHIRAGDRGKLLFDIEQGRIRPSKMLAERLVSMLKGNQEFVMIDDQKWVFEKALHLATKAQSGRKQVFIVQGGPGTGKSVVAMNLLARASEKQLLAAYVTKNAAPRAVYEQKLTGAFRRTTITNLFKGSGAFKSTAADTFDVLIVDEAHRLNEKSGLYGNEGVNQIMEIIHSSRASVFFLDEDQRVTFKDIGSREEIERWAAELNAEVSYGELASQFRCNGSDGFLAWIDHTLAIRDTANPLLTPAEFDFQVFDDPVAFREHTFTLNRLNNKARMVAGYCWDWKSRNAPHLFDIEFPGTDFRAQWNLASHGGLWITAPESVEQVGCIHTCQGLELDHIGVIIGPDLVVRGDQVITDGNARSLNDHSIKGFRAMVARDAAAAQLRAAPIIKNTYRTLMTRGTKSCSIYSPDEETREFFRSRLTQSNN